MLDILPVFLFPVIATSDDVVDDDDDDDDAAALLLTFAAFLSEGPSCARTKH